MTEAAGPDRASSPLRELAAQMGIVAEYFDLSGVLRPTSDDTRLAFLFALGVDASSERAAREALAALRATARDEMVAPVRVVRAGDPAAATLTVHLPLGAAAAAWRLDVQPESGGPLRSEGRWPADDSAELRLPGPLGLGHHRVRLTVASARREWVNEQTLIVAPARCVSPARVLGERRAFGLTANLYTVRSASNWGVGDLTDLGALASWVGSCGGDFVGVNPLHALLNRGPDVGPYSPVSRIFRNPIYIDVARVPELARAPHVREWLASPEATSEIGALRDADAVQYEAVMRLKQRVLTDLHRVFVDHQRDTGSARARDYAAYVAEHEPALTRFATWMAIAEEQGREWRQWPAELREPDAPAVRRYAEEHALRVDFHRWLQFETDRQLGDASHAARRAGMRVGLYQDLAIGTSDAGADSWAFPGLFVHGVTIGAPPDPYAAAGQNWHLPPIDPRALRRSGYEYFIKLLRTGFRHGGALRIDHVMGLFRLFWIPAGAPAAHGAYVRYPSEDLLGILALESARHHALVVGEDLGTVPPDVPPALARWGVLSSKVLYFERESNGEFKPATSYQSLSLATANTHDMPTIGGFWQGTDIDLRATLGALPDEHAVNQARGEREHARWALIRLLAAEGILASVEPPASLDQLGGAVNEFLCRTPSELVGLSLDDLAGELQAVNIPGVGPDRFPSWTRKMRLFLEAIASSDEVRTAMQCGERARPAASE